MTESPDATRPVPPYVSFATLLNQIERMARDGVPKRIDKSYLVGMSGGTQNQFKQAMRSLGLINGDDEATGDLVRLVTEDDRRPTILEAILRERFPDLVNLDLNATRGQLDDALQQCGGELGIDSRRKAATFYIHAAQFAGIPLSPHFKTGRTASGSTSARRPRRRRAAPATPAAGQDSPKPAANDMRQAYFELLLEKAKNSDQHSPDLLDRIERLIGIESTSPKMTPESETGRAGESS
jgi:hypothetical protein